MDNTHDRNNWKIILKKIISFKLKHEPTRVKVYLGKESSSDLAIEQEKMLENTEENADWRHIWEGLHGILRNKANL